MKPVEALEYYQTQGLKGEQAIKIDGVTGAVGVSDRDGAPKIIMAPTGPWKIATSSGAETTADQFLLTPGK